MFFRSERLFLRPGWPEDWSDLFRGIDDQDIVRNLASAPWPYRPDDARAFAALPQQPRHPHFLITLPGAEGGQTIGTVGLLAADDGRTELGYWIARAHWGRGYATEAARAALTMARTLGHRRIHASHFIDNPASGRVLRKVGFTSTGRIEPRYCCARGEAAPAEIHTVALGTPNDCGGGSDNPMKRAA